MNVPAARMYARDIFVEKITPVYLLRLVYEKTSWINILLPSWEIGDVARARAREDRRFSRLEKYDENYYYHAIHFNVPGSDFCSIYHETLTRAWLFGSRDRSLEGAEGERFAGRVTGDDVFRPGARKVVDIESRRSLEINR